MVFIGTSVIDADPACQLLSRKQPIGFDDIALTMDPFRFNGVEPGALCGQKARQDADPFALLLDLLVMLANEGSHDLALVKGGHCPRSEASSSCPPRRDARSTSRETEW